MKVKYTNTSELDENNDLMNTRCNGHDEHDETRGMGHENTVRRRESGLVEVEHEVERTNVKVAMIGASARRPIYVTTRR